MIYKTLTRIFAFAAAAALLGLAFAVSATMPIEDAAIPNPTREFYVGDFANVISADVEGEIVAKAADFHDHNDGAQVVVVTVDNLVGWTIEEFSIELARDWGIGDKSNDNGILLLINTSGESGKRMRIEVGDGLEGVITDGIAGEILDRYVVPRYNEGDFNAAARDGFLAILATINPDYSTDDIHPVRESVYDQVVDKIVVFMPIIIMLILIISSIFNRRRGGRGFVGAGFIGGFFGGGGGGFSGGGGGGGFSGGGGGFSGGGSSR
jgi:Beta-propeller domains of methanol dehydrogenase type